MMVAAEKGFVSVIQVLLAKGADSGRHDYTGRSALMWAEWSRRPAVARVLREAGVRE